MSEAALKRIEKAIGRLADQQAAICEKLASLEERIDSASKDESAPTDEVIAFLDQFRAGEALGEASLGAWIEVSDTPCVRGALRTVQMREGSHARLLEQRIKELGGSPSAEIPEPLYEKTMEQSGSREKTDSEKILAFVEQFPDTEAALQPIHDLADRLDGDPETQSLLRTIVADERATLECLNALCRELNP
jgi:hypothetical protein